VGVEAVGFDDSQWGSVDVPHTWNRIGNSGVERAALSNDVQGVGWYRLRFQTPQVAAGSRFFLQFDAVAALADVWLNGHYLGQHAGAFARFRFDATAAMKASGQNLLVVKADNSRPQPGATTENIIPLSGDFFIFGGIYRSVQLVVTQPVHVDMLDFGGPGVYAGTISLDAAAATVQVVGRLVNDAAHPATVHVQFAVEDAAGKVVAAKTLISSAAAVPTVLKAQLRIEHPRLWRGARDPYLYRSVMTVYSSAGTQLDRVSQPLGIRRMHFDPDHGFLLNDKPLSLKGASMHQDRPVKGWAISRADQTQDFDLLQDLGANAVRLAHYQHDQYSYELADARGIVVWAEVPLVSKVSFDGSPATAALTANARQQLIELVRQNYNHPSIAVWSLGNEVDLAATQTKGPSHPVALLQSLNELAKLEDPSRPTTLADCCEIGLAPHTGHDVIGIGERQPIVGIADTVGYNRYFGWYTGQFSDFGVMLDDAHALHARLPISVSEYGAGAALTQHTDDAAGGLINPHGRPHPEEYQNWYHEQSWAAIRVREFLWGAFIWNLFDFASDIRNEGDLTDINDKGLVSFDRQARKDAYFFYRANWSSEPTLHLVGSRYVDRAYAVNDVKAYSNATAARLSLNGREVGEVPCVGGICVWRAVLLSPGENEFTASAGIGGHSIKDTLRWTLSHSAALVRIKSGDITGYVSKDGLRYGSDMYFTGGTSRGINPPDTAASARIFVAADDPELYQSFREGEFVYRVPLPNGRYHVRLKFQEPDALAVGDRIFSVSVNGTVQLKDFDILSAAGAKLRAVDRDLDATVTNGVLELAFAAHRGSALISALSISPLDSK
jgi:beta-galactosidase